MSILSALGLFFFDDLDHDTTPFAIPFCLLTTWSIAMWLETENDDEA